MDLGIEMYWFYNDNMILLFCIRNIFTSTINFQSSKFDKKVLNFSFFKFVFEKFRNLYTFLKDRLFELTGTCRLKSNNNGIPALSINNRDKLTKNSRYTGVFKQR